MLKSDLERQASFERKQIKGGLEKIRSDTKKLLDKDYGSATVFGCASIETLLPYLIKYIDEKKRKRLEVAKGGAGHLMELLPFIMAIDTESQAAITAKLTFDKVFSYRKENSKILKVADAIGAALEAESQMRYYEDTAPALFKTLKDNYWHQAKGTEYKRKAMQTIIQKHNVPAWKTWTVPIRVKVGAWFLDCICESSGWFERVTKGVAKRSDQYIEPTPAFNKQKEEIVRLAELFSPMSWPMLVEPRDWSPVHEGGYYLNELTQCHEMVRRGVPLPIQGETIYKFLNSIQKVQYRLNDFTVGVAEELEERQIEVGKFHPVLHYPEPPKPHEDASKESWKDWKKKAATAKNKNANEWRASCRTRMTMNVVREFKGKDYWIPWSFDYRGRA